MTQPTPLPHAASVPRLRRRHRRRFDRCSGALDAERRLHRARCAATRPRQDALSGVRRVPFDRRERRRSEAPRRRRQARGKRRRLRVLARAEESDLAWDEATLDRWLTNPSALVPGTKMFFKLDDPQARADVIAYLKEQK
jgi:hypothetical protein